MTTVIRQEKSPPPQCRGDVFLRARDCKVGTWTPGCVIRCRSRERAGQRLYTRPGSLIPAPNGHRIGSPKYDIGSTNMVEGHFHPSNDALPGKRPM